MLQHSEVESFGILGAPLKFNNLYITFFKKHFSCKLQGSHSFIYGEN